jgi:hypothetical protein
MYDHDDDDERQLRNLEQASAVVSHRIEWVDPIFNHAINTLWAGNGTASLAVLGAISATSKNGVIDKRTLLPLALFQAECAGSRSDRFAAEACRQAHARRLAADWHDGQSSASRTPQISGLSSAVPFRQEGRSRVVTNAGWDAVDAATSGAQRGCRAGWRKACERSNGELTNDVAAYGEVVWS